MKPLSSRSRRIILVILGLLLLAGFARVVARSGPLAPVQVTVASVGTAQLKPALYGTGTVEARRAYVIGPTAPGRVAKVLVDVGDHVKAGQLLAEMDPVDLNDKIASLDASIARAGSAITAAQAQQQDARAREQLANLNEKRYVDLGAKNFVSQSAVEAKQQERIAAQAAATAAGANLASAQQDRTRLLAERDALVRQRDNIRLVAPVDGIITARDAEPGTTLVAGQSLIKLIVPASLWVNTHFDQSHSAGLAVGLPARITLRSRPNQPLPGKVARVEWLSDSVTEERVAQIAFDQMPAGVSVGELAEVTVDLSHVQTGLTVPNAAIRNQQGENGVWLLQDGKLHFQPVKLGPASLDGNVEITAGLKDGDKVVVYSERTLTAGTRVAVVDKLPEAGK